MLREVIIEKVPENTPLNKFMRSYKWREAQKNRYREQRRYIKMMRLNEKYFYEAVAEAEAEVEAEANKSVHVVDDIRDYGENKDESKIVGGFSETIKESSEEDRCI